MKVSKTSVTERVTMPTKTPRISAVDHEVAEHEREERADDHERQHEREER